MERVLIGMTGLAAAGLLAMVANWANHQPTFELVEERAGHVYVLDYDLSAADCLAALKPGTRCEVEVR